MARRRKEDGDPVRVRCVAANVWTDAGKMVRGDEAEMTRKEAESLGDKVEII